MKFLFIDCGGLHVDTARQLGKEGHEVNYHMPWVSAYPKFEMFAPGLGIKEINKVLDYGPYIDDADVIVFPDIGMGKLAHWLRGNGHNVFGAGLGEEMENDRMKSVEVMNKLGIKCPKTVVATGLTEALNTMKKLFGVQETNQKSGGSYFIKFNIWRGSLESFPAKSMEQVNFMFDSLRSSMGPYVEQIPVIIQEAIEGIETGADLFFNGETFLYPAMWGFEYGGNYTGLMTSDMTIFKEDLDKAATYLKSVNYRGAFSFECIFDGKDSYWIDWTCRFPMPLGLLYSSFSNGKLGEFIYGVATGEAKETPFPDNKYLGCLEIYSDEAIKKYLPLHGGDNTRFIRYMMNGDTAYSVPGVTTFVGAVCASGDNLQQLHDAIIEEEEKLDVYYGMCNTNFIHDTIEKYVEPIKKMGVNFGDGAMVESARKIVIKPSQSRAGQILQQMISVMKEY
jgi:hypothetical protein